MSDEQTPQSDAQQPAGYPGFPVTQEGLMLLHQEIGRLFHLGGERDILNGRLTRSGQAVMRTSEAFRSEHGPDKCRPLETAPPSDDGEQAQEPTPLARAAGGRKGG